MTIIDTEIHVGDIGTKLYATIVETINGVTDVVDVSNAILKKILLWKPDATVIQKDAEFVTDGTDGELVYTTVSGDLNLAGVWKIEAKVQLTNGTWHSEIKTFRVYDILVPT